jgi:RNA polymerase sigma-70 factor (ECF subfamily)
LATVTPEEIFARHHRDVFRYLLHMTGRREVADDLQQEVFLRVVRTLADGAQVGHERGWVFSIARNLVVDHRRESARALSPTEVVREPARPATQALAFGLEQALAALPESDRDVFLMKEVAGLRYDEIASACGCTVEAVRNRLFRTRSALRRLLTLE